MGQIRLEIPEVIIEKNRCIFYSLLFSALMSYALTNAFAQDAQSGTLVPGQTVTNRQGVVVVQNNGPSDKCQRCPLTRVPPAPSPAPPITTSLPPIPAGFVVVQSTYLEQVAATAKSAIDSAKANEESLVGIMKVAGVVLGALAIILTYLGFQEYKSIQEIKQKLNQNLAKSKKKLLEVEKIKGEVVPRLEASVWEMQELTSIMLDMNQLSLKIDEVEILRNKNNLTELKRVATLALAAGEELFVRADSLYKRRTAGTQATEKRQSEALERILSYIVATLCVFSMRTESLDAAVRWAEQSVHYNPMKYDDREYNHACALSKRFDMRKASEDEAAAMGILEKGMSAGVWTWKEIWDDEDFTSIRASLLKSQHAIHDYAAGKSKQA